MVAFETAHSLTANGVVTYAQTRVLRQVVATALAGGAVTQGDDQLRRHRQRSGRRAARRRSR